MSMYNRPDTFAQFLIPMRDQGIDLQGFILLDASFEADATLAPNSVNSIKDLKDQSIAYEFVRQS